MAEYLLGIDRGTTNVKAVLFDLDGNEVKKASRASGEIRRPFPGWNEQDMDLIWTRTREAIHDLFDEDIRPEDVIAVGVCGQGNGVFLIDGQGNPVRNGILSVDTRSKNIVAQLNEEGIVSRSGEVTKFPLSEASPTSLLKWLKENERDSYDKAKHFCFSKDWVKYKLTGEICTDQSDAGGAGLIDVAKGEYCVELLDWLEIKECKEKLPAIVPTWEVCGRVTKQASEETGLVEGTPVVSGAHDIAACSWGAGGTNEGHLTIIVGTWGLNMAVLNELDVNQSLNVPAFYHAIPDRWLATNGDGNSGSSLDWFIKTFCEYEMAEAARRSVSVYEVIEEQVANVPPAPLLYQPFIFGMRGAAQAKGGLLGMGDWHTKADILKAVYEGIAYSHAMYIEALQEIVNIETAFLVGGGAQSRIWPQIFADVMGFPISVPSTAEVASRGAALSAGVGAGVFKNHAEANLLLDVKKQYMPDAERHEKYVGICRAFKRSIEDSTGVWDDLCDLAKVE
jgi:L-xylulokinase